MLHRNASKTYRLLQERNWSQTRLYPNADQLNAMAIELGLHISTKKKTNEHQPLEIKTNMNENLRPTM